MNADAWHIVIIDDSPDDRAEARRCLLKGSDRRYAFTEAATGAAGMHALREGAAAQNRCVVLDYNLPDMAAPEFLAAIRGSDGLPAWPVVVFTGDDTAETGRCALRAGAHDYVGKNWMTPQALVRAVENAAERWAMARELHQQKGAAQASEQQLRTLADNTPDILSRFDRQLRHVFINAAAERTTGRACSEFLGRTNRELGMPIELCDMWDAALHAVFDKGQIVTGKVKTVDPKGAEIDLGQDIIAYLRASEISRDRVEDARNVLKEGDEVTAVVVNVDRKTRNIQLSIKAKDAVDQQEAMASLSQSSQRENAGTTSLGALLRAKLDNNN